MRPPGFSLSLKMSILTSFGNPEGRRSSIFFRRQPAKRCVTRDLVTRGLASLDHGSDVGLRTSAHPDCGAAGTLDRCGCSPGFGALGTIAKNAGRRCPPQRGALEVGIGAAVLRTPP